MVFNSPGWDMLFAVVYDYEVEAIYASVFASVGFHVKIR